MSTLKAKVFGRKFLDSKFYCITSDGKPFYRHLFIQEQQKNKKRFRYRQRKHSDWFDWGFVSSLNYPKGFVQLGLIGTPSRRKYLVNRRPHHLTTGSLNILFMINIIFSNEKKSRLQTKITSIILYYPYWDISLSRDTGTLTIKQVPTEFQSRYFTPIWSVKYPTTTTLHP